jgi:hypothetical protein
MIFRSKRSTVAILSGLIVCFLFAYFTRITWFAPILGVLITVNIAKAFTPKEGALLGALVPVPSGIFATLPVFIYNYQQAQNTRGALGLIFAGVIGIMLLMLMGAFYGFVLGKLIQFFRKKETILF